MAIGYREWICLALTGLCVVPGTGLGQDSRTGNEAENPKDPSPLHRRLRTLAEAGEPVAQVELGDWYQQSGDYTNAVIWYRLSAQNGNLSAQLALAGILLSGRGVAEDRRQAAFWLRRAADSVEFPGPSDVSAAGAGEVSIPAFSRPVKSIIITRATTVDENKQSDAGSAGAVVGEKLFTNLVSRSTRESRADNLVIAEPVLQERSTLVQPSGNLR